MKLTIPRSLLLGAVAAAFPTFGASEELHIDGGTEYGWGNNWYVQVDGVMGGKSSGKMEFLEDNSVMKFTGDIILDGGGFSSVRRRIDLDLSEYAGVVVTVEAAIGEGTTPPPGFHLQFSDRSSYYDFSSAFAVPLSNGDSDGAVVTSVYLPMDSFNRGSRAGFQCRGTCELNPSDINGMSVYMLFQEGGFDVRLRSIEAVEEPRAFPLPEYDGLETADDIVGLIRSTISSGGGLYDKSYVELCINMYWSVLNTILSSDSEAASESVKAVICAGLQQVEDQMEVGDTKQNIAWTLRYAMDAVIADLQGSSRTTVQDWLPTVDEASSMEVLCVGRTSPAQGFMYDPTNEYILVSEDDEEEPPSNSQNEEEAAEPLSENENDSIEPPSNSQTDEEAEETLIANENDSVESPTVSEETDKESPAENEEIENDPLSNSETESNESNQEEVEVAQIEEPEEENVGESTSENDTEEEQLQTNDEEEDEPPSSSENEEGGEEKEGEEPPRDADIEEEMPEATEEEKEESLSEISDNEKTPQSSEEEEEETLTSSEKEVEQEEKEVEESLSEINSNKETPQASEEEEEETLASSENEGEEEESPVSNQGNQGDPTIVSKAQEEPPSSGSGTEDKGLTNSTFSFDEADPVIKASAVDSSQFSSGSPSLSGYGFGSVVAGFMLLGVVQ